MQNAGNVSKFDLDIAGQWKYMQLSDDHLYVKRCHKQSTICNSPFFFQVRLLPFFQAKRRMWLSFYGTPAQKNSILEQ